MYQTGSMDTFHGKRSCSNSGFSWEDVARGEPQPGRSSRLFTAVTAGWKQHTLKNTPPCSCSVPLSPASLDLLLITLHISFDKSSPKLRMPWCLWGCLARGCWIRRAPRTHHSGTHHSDSNPTCTGCSSSVVPLLCVWGLFPTLSVTQPFFPG